jgi:hypothetical protein
MPEYGAAAPQHPLAGHLGHLRYLGDVLIQTDRIVGERVVQFTKQRGCRHNVDGVAGSLLSFRLISALRSVAISEELGDATSANCQLRKSCYKDNGKTVLAC